MQRQRLTCITSEKALPWLTRDHRRLYVHEMSAEHRKSLLAWLERQASKWHARWISEMLKVYSLPIHGEYAELAKDAEFDQLLEETAVDWMARQPFVKRLREMSDAA